ncbi:ribosomal protein L7/L12 [Streptantibioticus cattleyicolor]|uniref:Large ribosomal subunit protein bL12 C-terminal domain-containing protein n=1 Tax=Streptantibioticus cattleyicolor (strain ATCC 35852 / DSM 46488 / JCM 4925 / NBRC 14057 / NRRL 8057) TaxID=1003195 RepID=F8JNL8_STREN|nr:ribosomal protein L7/L12 [Streptantibioticus cattleyicolor]AEW99014.1 hypothetical protein SCATT_p08210 [Streptantibioticus cattleyicolor NRRL 8057 = DSM 46488]CCB71939.1 conserved protein of unknown function [Streptantibioticus cattleyicolor NRRL 8057 = DSM 46488]
MDIAVYLLIALTLTLAATVERKVGRVERKVAQVERKLDLIMAHLGVEAPEPELSRVRALLAEGKKIEAIKAYREITDADLKEAKDAVDRMAESPS